MPAGLRLGSTHPGVRVPRGDAPGAASERSLGVPPPPCGGGVMLGAAAMCAADRPLPAEWGRGSADEEPRRSGRGCAKAGTACGGSATTPSAPWAPPHSVSPAHDLSYPLLCKAERPCADAVLPLAKILVGPGTPLGRHAADRSRKHVSTAEPCEGATRVTLTGQVARPHASVPSHAAA